MNAATSSPVEWLNEYQALLSGAGLVDLGPRTQIEVRGEDRASWLNNLTTNEVRKQSPGSGCETFLTTVQGKTLAHVLLFAGPDSVVLDTVGGQAETILKHLDHYLITEHVTLADKSEDWGELYLAGTQAAELLRGLAGVEPPAHRLQHTGATLAGRDVWIRRVDMTGPDGFVIAGTRDDVSAIGEAILAAGAVSCRYTAFDAARIEWGFPLFGQDITDKNLPQEVARDDRAISFVKGCYLGQETVARIDALGHVNRTLVGVNFSGQQVLDIGAELFADEAAVGTITSACYSPQLKAPLALAYVRRGNNSPGVRLQSAVGEAEVVTLPVRSS
jgi:folate-binding protein YgfZ